MFVQCTLVKLSSWFTSSWGVLVYSSGLSYSLQWPWWLPNSLHWETRWFSLQRGKRLVALGWFQTLADCKSTTKLVVFRLVINHSSCPCILFSYFAFVSNFIFQLKYNSVFVSMICAAALWCWLLPGMRRACSVLQTHHRRRYNLTQLICRIFWFWEKLIWQY